MNNQNNIELNSALLNMGYRYMGIQNDKCHVWGKPIGYSILAAYVTPGLEDIKIASLCTINDIENNGIKTSFYDSLSYNSNRNEVHIENATYEDFLNFIKYAEYSCHIEESMYCNVSFNREFDFKIDMDYESQKFITY